MYLESTDVYREEFVGPSLMPYDPLAKVYKVYRRRLKSLVCNKRRTK